MDIVALSSPGTQIHSVPPGSPAPVQSTFSIKDVTAKSISRCVISSATVAAVAMPVLAKSRRRRRGTRIGRRQAAPEGQSEDSSAPPSTPRNPFMDWRESGYAVPGFKKDKDGGDKKKKGYTGDDWGFGVREMLGGKERQLQEEANLLAQRVAMAEKKQSALNARMEGAEARESSLQEALREEQEKANYAQEQYEALTEQVEQAQMERDLALGGKAGRAELEIQIEKMKEDQIKLERDLQESRAREAERANELKERETELVTVRREKVVLSKELDDARVRERELTMLLEEAQNQIMELTADEADELLADLDLDDLDEVPPPPPPPPTMNNLPPPPPAKSSDLPPPPPPNPKSSPPLPPPPPTPAPKAVSKMPPPPPPMASEASSPLPPPPMPKVANSKPPPPPPSAPSIPSSEMEAALAPDKPKAKAKAKARRAKAKSKAKADS